MLAGLSSRQLREWEQFDQLEPLGPKGDDFRAATIAIAAMAPYMKAGKTIRPGDLFPSLKTPAPETQERDKWLTWVAGCGGDIEGLEG